MDTMERFNHCFSLFEELKKEPHNILYKFSEANCRLRVEILSELKEITMEADFQRQYFPFEIAYIDDMLSEAKLELESNGEINETE